MSKYNVGDRVTCVSYASGAGNQWAVGLTGTVVNRGRHHDSSALVRFAVEDAKGNGHGVDKAHWYLNDADLVPAATVTKTPPSAAADLRLTPQAKTVLRHLKTVGDISPMKALTIYGYTRLASCIHEIRRKAGYSVDCEMRSDAMGHRYACYSLAKALVH